MSIGKIPGGYKPFNIGNRLDLISKGSDGVQNLKQLRENIGRWKSGLDSHEFNRRDDEVIALTSNLGIDREVDDYVTYQIKPEEGTIADNVIHLAYQVSADMVAFRKWNNQLTADDRRDVELHHIKVPKPPDELALGFVESKLKTMENSEDSREIKPVVIEGNSSDSPEE